MSVSTGMAGEKKVAPVGARPRDLRSHEAAGLELGAVAGAFGPQGPGGARGGLFVLPAEAEQADRGGGDAVVAGDVGDGLRLACQARISATCASVRARASYGAVHVGSPSYASRRRLPVR